MEFIVAAHSDVGIKKKTNQDSVLIDIANTDYGKVCLAVICDGMGGLEKGEVASASLVKTFEKWFEEEFPQMLYQGIAPEALKSRWEKLLRDKNVEITNYGIEHHVRLGTTVVCLLIVGDIYYVVHVGDSRAYMITDNFKQMTKDQTFIQREMDAGRMTPEQAAVDPQRNVLLQCVGASDYIEPDFQFGQVPATACFLLCSDGFRHVLSEQEIYEYTNPTISLDTERMTQNLIYLIELNKYRRENDNISAALIRVC